MNAATVKEPGAHASARNLYVPYLATVVKIRREVKGARAIKTFRMQFNDPKIRESFNWKVGQCVMVSVLGVGESMFAISSPPSRPDYLEVSVMKVGKHTHALHQLEVGDIVGLRGPYGNGFPVEDWKGKNLIFIGGGIGQAPLRAVYQYVLDNRVDYGELLLIYGARSSRDMAYLDELAEYEQRGDIDIRLCLDWKFGPGGKIVEEAEPGWKCINPDAPECTDIDSICTRFTCFVPELVLVESPSPENAIALTCGPPIMIRFVTENLAKLDFTDDQIYTTLENRMKCGIGKCGRCNIGSVYVCKDGPVFTYAQIKGMLQEF